MKTGKLRFIVVAIAATFAFASACTGAGSQDDDVVVVEYSEIFPFQSLSDWVTYSDQVSVVEIVSEERFVALEGVEVDDIGRRVTARVERTLWSASTKPASEVTFITDGWISRDGKDIPIWPVEGLRLAVGGRYVLPLFDSSGEWGVLNVSSIIPLDDDTVHEQFEAISPGAKLLEGIGINTLEDQLANTKPDPLAAQLDAGLSPTQRAVEISRIRDGELTGSDAEEQDIIDQSPTPAEDLTEQDLLEIEGSGG